MLKDLYLGVTLPFVTPAERRNSQKILAWLLNVVARLNFFYLERHPGTPPLYESGVRYAPPDQSTAPPVDKARLTKIFAELQAMGLEPEVGQMVLRLVRGAEIFLDIPALYRRQKGDCNELVPVRVAELWRAGIAANSWLVDPVPNANGGLTYHTVVLWPDGSAEDPSLILGMGGAARAADKAEEIRKNQERWDMFLAEAHRLIDAELASPKELGRQLDLMGLLPRAGAQLGVTPPLTEFRTHV